MNHEHVKSLCHVIGIINVELSIAFIFTTIFELFFKFIPV